MKKNKTKWNARAKKGAQAALIGAGTNISLFIVKLLVGLQAGSLSIVADSLNNLSDTGSSLVTLFGFSMGRRPADREHPFGHGRYEYIAALLVAVLVLLIGVELIKSAVERILQPQPITFSFLGAALLACSILAKLGLAIFYRRKGKKLDSQALTASAADARNDMLVTAATLVCLCAALVTPIPLDGWLSALVGLFIVWSGFKLVKDTIDPLLGLRPGPEVTKPIEEILLTYPEILGLHDLAVHNYGPGRLFASVHAEVEAQGDIIALHEAIDQAEMRVLKEQGVLLTIHMDPIFVLDETTHRYKELALHCLHKLDSRLTLHDFRIVDGKNRVVLLFDAVAPAGFAVGQEELNRKINEALQKQNPCLQAIIRMDFALA